MWRYRLSTPFRWQSPHLLGVEFSNRWVHIQHAQIHIAAGYAWDGCSPTLRLAGGALWLGPWDGPLMPDGRPATFHASLVHDALCQFRRELHGLTKEATVALFADMLRQGGAPGWMCRLYPLAVRHFGPQNWQKTQ